MFSVIPTTRPQMITVVVSLWLILLSVFLQRVCHFLRSKD